APQARPALHLPRAGSGAGRRGTGPASAGDAHAGRARARRDARRPRTQLLRSLGSRAVRGIRAEPRRRVAGRLRPAGANGSLAVHLPVLIDEVVFLLRPRREGWLIDGTVGMGGHAEAMLETTNADVRLLG